MVALHLVPKLPTSRMSAELLLPLLTMVALEVELGVLEKRAIEEGIEDSINRRMTRGKNSLLRTNLGHHNLNWSVTDHAQLYGLVE
ncbi:unnamed protein product [Dovyalis caffra]|uniref:Uncharacterized protein n=1 Tax=Dovyalis caffra TaxID=77055 RepID=A0AAV1RMU5_9ROSI|nr:unnamed protein product [Dovyalis caffra]